MLLSSLLFVMVSIGCALGDVEDRSPMPSIPVLSEKPDEARRQLLREIPLGIDMATAGQRLESLGFKVTRKSSDDYFARLDKNPGGLVATSWLVSIRGEKQKLQELTVKVGYIGP